MDRLNAGHPSPRTPAGAVALALADRVAGALQEALGPALLGLIVKGSALHDDFIPGYSDLDMHAFVRDEVLAAPQALELGLALEVQAALARLDLDGHGVGSLQLYFIAWSEGYPTAWSRPWPGTYRVLHGTLPPGFEQVQAAEYRQRAHECLGLFPRWGQDLFRRVVNTPDAGLPGLVREVGAVLKPLLFVTASLVTGEPEGVWRGYLADALAVVEPGVSPSGSFTAFFDGVRAWPPEPARARRLLADARVAIDESVAWYQAQAWPAADVAAVRELSPW